MTVSLSDLPVQSLQVCFTSLKSSTTDVYAHCLNANVVWEGENTKCTMIYIILYSNYIGSLVYQ